MAESSAQAERTALLPTCHESKERWESFTNDEMWPLVLNFRSAIPAMTMRDGIGKFRDRLAPKRLYPFSEVTEIQAPWAVRNGLGVRGCHLTKDVSGDPKAILDIITTNYRPEGLCLPRESRAPTA